MEEDKEKRERGGGEGASSLKLGDSAFDSRTLVTAWYDLLCKLYIRKLDICE